MLVGEHGKLPWATRGNVPCGHQGLHRHDLGPSQGGVLRVSWRDAACWACGPCACLGLWAFRWGMQGAGLVVQRGCSLLPIAVYFIWGWGWGVRGLRVGGGRGGCRHCSLFCAYSVKVRAWVQGVGVSVWPRYVFLSEKTVCDTGSYRVWSGLYGRGWGSVIWQGVGGHPGIKVCTPCNFVVERTFATPNTSTRSL